MNLQAGDFDWIVRRDILQQTQLYTVRRVFEPAVSLAVPRTIGRVRVADWQSRRSPQLAGLLIAQIQCFPRTIGDRVVRPGRELILATVSGPGIPAAFCGHLEAKVRIGDDVDPRGRSRLARSQEGQVFLASGGKAPKTIEKFEVRWSADQRCGRCRCVFA